MVVNRGRREIVTLEIGDALFKEVPVTIANCPPFPEVGEIMSAIVESTSHARTDTELCFVRSHPSQAGCRYGSASGGCRTGR